jgi:hypothetical protein
MAKQAVKPPPGHRAHRMLRGVSVACECGWGLEEWGENAARNAYAAQRKHWIDCGAVFDPGVVNPVTGHIKK